MYAKHMLEFLITFCVHAECELNLNGTESRGSIAFLASSSVTSDNALFCSCPNNTVDLILPDGSVAVDDSAIDVLSAPGSIRIFPKSGMLSQGVYVCRINGQDQLYAYVLDSEFIAINFGI